MSTCAKKQVTIYAEASQITLSHLLVTHKSHGDGHKHTCTLQMHEFTPADMPVNVPYHSEAKRLSSCSLTHSHTLILLGDISPSPLILMTINTPQYTRARARAHTSARQQAPQILESNYRLHFVYYLLREAGDRVCACVRDKISPVFLLSGPAAARLCPVWHSTTEGNPATNWEWLSVCFLG